MSRLSCCLSARYVAACISASALHSLQDPAASITLDQAAAYALYVHGCRMAKVSGLFRVFQVVPAW